MMELTESLYLVHAIAPNEMNRFNTKICNKYRQAGIDLQERVKMQTFSDLCIHAMYILSIAGFSVRVIIAFKKRVYS